MRLTPASLTKLAVAAAALNVWPADKMFKTQLLAARALSTGTLTGDLYLVGAGDPSLTGESLLSLAAQVKSAGITAVTGKLFVIPSPFASVLCETKDRCEAGMHSDNAYDAPLASIGTDFGTWCVDVRATTYRQACGGHRLHHAIADRGSGQCADDTSRTKARCCASSA